MLLDEKDRLQFMTMRCVCPQWRSVAFTTQDLWRGLEVTLPLQGRDRVALPAKTNLEILNSWFNRGGTGNPPLRFVVTLSARKEYGCSKVAEDLFPLLSTFLVGRSWVEFGYFRPGMQLHGADLLGDVDEAWTEVGLTVPAHPWITLRTMSLDVGYEADYTLGTANFPALKSLYVTEWEIHDDDEMPEFSIEHDGLESLHLEFCSAASVDLIALALSQESVPALKDVILEQCNFNGHSPNSLSVEAPSPPEAIRSNASVERLVVVGDASITGLHCLALPQLRVLRLDVDGDEFTEETWSCTIKPFLERSTSHLHTLSIEGSHPFDSEELAFLISSAPSLHTLRVASLERLFDRIDGQEVSLPHLSTIVLSQPLRPSHLHSSAMNEAARYFTQRLAAMDGQRPPVVRIVHRLPQHWKVYEWDRLDERQVEKVHGFRRVGVEIVRDLKGFFLHLR
ncbi:hypothetical protein CC1G_12453 [Coprinopsis cinerea okayama7|uniref:F-box domain-containing protein n=1 Tax=Coprinopsis cinerea (strain Okayama-7 / 130 / ATCC MYA-4618 / FGSC 9003) TaxID=240176 RepID=A8NKY8_COPC7|nr:hypothetical protein CC1G_12453 [Coprinopsis cinerea okayama7\|eukprot:XP_001834575.1 hypothetical protein CC1G_12453 [Coprinopsis cinerea okayama7\